MDLENAINQILVEWDPIGVGQHTDIQNEYSRYVREIIEVMGDRDKLKELIYDIEGNRIGFFYTSNKDKEKVIDKIYNLSKS